MIHPDGYIQVRDRAKDIIRGQRNGRVFKIGQEVSVKIFETNALTGGIELTLLQHEGKTIETHSHRKNFSNSKKKSRRKKKKYS